MSGSSNQQPGQQPAPDAAYQKYGYTGPTRGEPQQDPQHGSQQPATAPDAAAQKFGYPRPSAAADRYGHQDATRDRDWGGADAAFKKYGNSNTRQ